MPGGGLPLGCLQRDPAPGPQGSGRAASPAVVDAGLLRLHWRPFQFSLPQELVTAHGALRDKRGWLLKLEAPDGRLGWGEAASLTWKPIAGGAAGSGDPAGDGSEDPIAGAIAALGSNTSQMALERRLPGLTAPLSFALGLALAELDGLGGADDGWRSAPASAQLLPAGDAMPPALETILRSRSGQETGEPAPLTFKWKVAAGDDGRERELLEWLLQRLPPESRLRLDANGGWDRATADGWASRLVDEPRLDWLEQPLPARDRQGLLALARRLPVALDESLRPWVGQGSESAIAASALFAPWTDWPGWLVCRPALDGDPRPLLGALRRGRPRLMLSTALETGIGRRLLAHLAALQQQGPTPTAPGLAPGWRPVGGLFSADPQEVWRSAEAPA